MKREEHRLGVLRRVFGPNTDEATGGRRELHNEWLHNLYSPPDIITVIKDELGGACSTHEGDEKSVQNFDLKARSEETTRKT
jgi:hypothetical protein